MTKSVKALLLKFLPQSVRSKLIKSYLKNIRPLVYRGHNVYCPVCGGNFRLFLPAGPTLIRRENAECPSCTSKERHRLFWLYLQNQTSFFTEKAKVLHFAPEPFFQNLFVKMKNLEYVSMDLYSPLAMVQGDIRDIPFEDECFDVIFCSHVLEHVTDDHQAMHELHRVLKQGGWAIIQVPIDPNMEKTLEDPNIVTPEDRIRYYWNKNHVRLYGRDYKDRLEKAGFQVKVDNYVKTLDTDFVNKHGLLRKENIYLCQKLAA